MVQVLVAPVGDVQAQLQLSTRVELQLALMVLPSQVQESEHEAMSPLSEQLTPPIAILNVMPWQ